MPLNGKYTSFKTILDETYRDNQYTIEVPWQDAVEWIYDAMELIRVKTQYIDKKVKLPIENYRALLPCDFHRITQAAGSFGGCYPFAMRETTNTFHTTSDTCEWTKDIKYLNGDSDPTAPTQQTPIGEDAFGNPVYELGSRGLDIALNAGNTASVTPSLEDVTYKINENYVFTNYKDGFVYLAYEAIPVDEEGYPLIPEDTKYKEAVKAYLRMKIDYLLNRKGMLADKHYHEAIQLWSFRCGQAQNEAKIPSIDQMESIKNQQKLVQNNYHHNNFFRKLGN